MLQQTNTENHITALLLRQQRWLMFVNTHSERGPPKVGAALHGHIPAQRCHLQHQQLVLPDGLQYLPQPSPRHPQGASTGLRTVLPHRIRARHHATCPACWTAPRNVNTTACTAQAALETILPVMMSLIQLSLPVLIPATRVMLRVLVTVSQGRVHDQALHVRHHSPLGQKTAAASLAGIHLLCQKPWR
jgi:hypothetical protein